MPCAMYNNVHLARSQGLQWNYKEMLKETRRDRTVSQTIKFMRDSKCKANF